MTFGQPPASILMLLVINATNAAAPANTPGHTPTAQGPIRALPGCLGEGAPRRLFRAASRPNVLKATEPETNAATNVAGRMPSSP